MSTTWSRKFYSYHVEINPDTGQAIRVYVTAQVIADGEAMIIDKPDEGEYTRDVLGPVALAKLDDFTADVLAKWNADHELPDS
jgi:hypothetical protein